MSLPEWTSQGLLPPGRHTGTMDDVHDRCVIGAPNTARRQELFGSLITFTELAKRIIGPCQLWVDGGFVTAKAHAPFDVDVVIKPGSWDHLRSYTGRERDRVFGMLTLQDVVVGEPLYLGFERIQPLAGELDAFLCYPGQDDVWHDTWSAVKGDDGEIIEGAVKGYIEVAL
ncbi:Uncharacterised protein [Mycobacteroides abscessus]|uniref:Uncharacterized protein n=3 Tax=root TaxID=1 RepID=A0A9Q7WMD8_9MYCO|nr:hypothetical protein KDJ10_gp38 [Mycobacterium phage phiT46-1]QSM02833.1 nucleotidyltransferase [Mycobacterium phage prophi58-1]QSM03129.1 nucleotidyltransferase [Mycobacterium phage prophiGD24-2]QSM03463.1 nucleotidyltransferase [Mycobacterium phage prophiGD21-3]WJJ56711.1 nucleotidyltransferase [Mycobacterium phage prophiT46-1]CPR57221.1 Uncharacterised protein [Mycobacteroides abscessus]SHP10680.1 Uncharacterised protein [Mycobacteroides abscessus subsp. abscessus]SIJ33088.1 Uncharacte